ARRSTQGRVAEVLGADYLDFDKATRRNYNPVSIMQQLAALNADDRAILEGYAAGLNAWIDTVRDQPEVLLPKQFLDNGFQPQHWSGFDVAMIFIGSMGNRFGDYNTELDNQKLLDGMIKQHGEDKGWAIFNQINPVSDPKAPTTLPKSQPESVPPPGNPTASLSSPPTPARPAAERPQVLAVTGSGTDTPATPPRPGEGFSNMVIVGKAKAADANAILLNGPQFGWYVPAYTYSIGLHGAGFDLVGNSAFGYPAVMFGYNRNISWGSTWGAADVVDIYQETLNPDNPHEYRFMGEYLPMQKRTETIAVKGGESVSLDVWQTVHGLVVEMDEDKGVAYSKKRTWAGREIETLLGWTRSTQAENYEQWRTQAARSAMNINWYYADKEGNIGYALTGAYPQRLPQHDNRLPASGEGDREWQGIQPFSDNPQVYNPETGYIANWNNRPGPTINNPDEYWYSWSQADRVEVLTRLLEAKERFTAEEIRQLMADAALMDPNARYFIPYIEQATADLAADDPLRQAAQTLSEWDYFSRDQDNDGHYDGAATAIFQTWLPLMLEASLKDDLGDYFKWFASAGYPTPESPPGSGVNVQIGTKAVYEALLGKQSGIAQDYNFFNDKDPLPIIRDTLQAALATLEKRFGADPASWRLPIARLKFRNTNFLNIPQSGEDEIMQSRIAMNRGTENNQTVFTPEGVTGFEVVPPGQSGFIGPDGKPSIHYNNQLGLYDDFQYKRTWLDARDVDAHAKSSITLKYSVK
ncbi:MAG: penicillin acylase family protein, partial [Thiothrix sp.]|nr:penicillin acylase family protein [Thiothrix sp.]